MVKPIWVLPAIVAIDVLTKLIVKASLLNLEIIPGVLSLNYLTNTGAAFGLFRGGNITLLFFGLIILGIGLIYYDKLLAGKDRWCYLLIGAGIIGNLIDRIAYGAVIDFIDFHIWPAFNLADAAMCIGVLGIIAYWVFPNSKARNLPSHRL